MGKARSDGAREKLIPAAIELFRRHGYVATTVEAICERAGVTKGAFFHYFESKEALAEACLAEWNAQTSAMEAAAPFHAVSDPLKRLLACIDFFIALFENPNVIKSCLAGTTVQEVSETYPALRDAANVCFVNAEQRFKALLDAARKHKRRRVDTASLAKLWISTVQGSLVLYKASGDESVIRTNLEHLRDYIQSLFSKRR